MDINTLRSLITVLAVAGFLGIVWWAYSARRKADFDAAARLPLDDEGPVASAQGHQERKAS